MSTTPEQRAELLALADKATPRPGEWQYKLMKRRGHCVFFRDTHPSGLPFNNHLFDDGCDWGGDTALYIAAACNLAPDLAREVERLQREVKDLKEELRDLQYGYHTEEREFSA